MPAGHVPVLFQETLGLLKPAAGETFLDGTVGAGGHAEGIAEAVGSSGLLVCGDADEAMLAIASERLRRFPQVRMVHADYSDLEALAEAAGGRPFDGMLLDLGLSSPQLADPARGFSFLRDGPLDMRRDPSAGGRDARRILRTASERDLADLFFRLGEERFSRRIARAVVERRRSRPIERTTELAELVCSAIPRRAWPRSIHPATRVFQALRIAVNGELESLGAFLEGFPAHLAPGGRAAVISFHSLEDRMVKVAFRSLSAGKAAPFSLLTRKPVVPDAEEVAENRRAASARLRAVRHDGGGGG